MCFTVRETTEIERIRRGCDPEVTPDTVYDKWTTTSRSITNFSV